MTITINRSLRLPKSEYFADAQRKTGIAIHHTVCRGAKTAFDSWLTDGNGTGGVRHVATAYLIDEDGEVFELFDPQAWAWQFGLAWPDPARTTFEKRFIGIEIASEGGLLEPRDQAFDYGRPYRGYRWFARYQGAQLESLAALVEDLCGRFSIPRVYPGSPFDYYGEALQRFAGVIGHAMVRSDKSDPAPDPVLWQILGSRAGLIPAAIASPGPSVSSRLPGATDIEALFRENLKAVNAMSPAAGSLAKDLLMELQRRGVILRLSNPDTHSIDYEVAEGARGQVVAVASALGLVVTDRTIEVRGQGGQGGQGGQDA